MGAKMKKGLYKGLRYFSNMFDPKEQEMQIGYPTDVKHVAHIGWDGTSENTPSWMNDFRSAPLTATVTEDPADVPQFPSSELILTGELPRRSGPRSSEKTERTEKPSQRKKSSDEWAAASESPKRETSSLKHSRRRQSTSGGSGDSVEGSRRSRRESKERNSEGAGARENEAPGIPKQSRRRRTKGSSSNSGCGGSTQARSRAHGNADQGIREGSDEFPPPLKPAKGREEENS